ncbi:MAG: RES family NAD+ phosphorylase [Brevibacterium aurantiacum]|nr:RES family NAD+ phosphorylase [Brevibacterium aurantiacum]
MKSLLVFVEERARLVRDIEKDTLLYRARIERDARELEKAAREKPAAELGPPPVDKASAGRMNAQGIPLFYVAFDEETACVEVSSHSPYDEAVVGAFALQRPLRILDLSRVPPPRSPFDDSYIDGDDRLAFFSEYVERITRPVILDGNHPVDYAPTQVLTEFFRWATAPRLAGIVFRSRAGGEGRNAVLFFGDDFWFTQLGVDTSSMARHQRWDERGTEDPLFVIDPKTIRRYRVERAMTVKRTRF